MGVVKKVKSKKRFMFIVVPALFLGVIISLLGGLKLMIYLMLLLSGLFVGWTAHRVWIVIKDYRLALKVNTLQFNAKQTEQLQGKLRDLEQELHVAKTRLDLQKGAQS